MMDHNKEAVVLFMATPPNSYFDNTDECKSEPTTDENNSTNNNGTAAVYCKVCGSFVPKKKKYNPSICEACKKFFTRTCKRQEENLPCQTGKQNCTIDGRNRRFCTSCRFAKCLTVGMRCRLWNSGNDSDESSASDEIIERNSGDGSLSARSGHASSQCRSSVGSAAEAVGFLVPFVQKVDFNEEAVFPVSNESQREKEAELLLPLVNDPILFDGALAETTMRLAARATTYLHGLEFMPLRIYKGPITDMWTMWQASLRQLFEASAIGFTYGRQLTEAELIPERDAEVLISAFLPGMSIIYNMMPGTTTATFIGVNDAYIPAYFTFFPMYHAAYDTMKQLGALVSEWNPTFPQYAIFVAFSLFDLGNIDSEQVRRIRRRLLMILNLHLSQAFSPERVLSAQLYFKQGYRLLQRSIQKLRDGIAVQAVEMSQLVATSQLYSEILLTEPEQTRIGSIFPKDDDSNRLNSN